MTFNLEVICKDAAKKLGVQLKSLSFDGVFDKYCNISLKGSIDRNPDILWELEDWANCRTYSRRVDTRGSEICYEGKNEKYLFVYAKLIEK
ncbi:MAG: hypothetical protein AABX39_01165, partial [Nanoarchaeota archaeon]